MPVQAIQIHGVSNGERTLLSTFEADPRTTEIQVHTTRSEHYMTGDKADREIEVKPEPPAEGEQSSESA